ncbi:MAG TPA: TadE/TadG family type IV pilus assembly protein [Dongiaceae bacterium]|nr:TadE/TadG family type IV pilus assembly protein [Dongiaceae bacterium]
MTASPRDLRRDKRGSVLVEFAIILPVMVALFFGVFEGTRAIRARMSMSNAAAAYADMIAMQGSLTPAQLANFCDGARLVMYPFSTETFAAAVSSVTNSPDQGVVAEDWHDTTHCGVAAAVSSPTTVAVSPTNMVPHAGDSVIIVRVTYSYRSSIHVILPGRFTFTQTVFARPRSNAVISCSECS